MILQKLCNFNIPTVCGVGWVFFLLHSPKLVSFLHLSVVTVRVFDRGGGGRGGRRCCLIFPKLCNFIECFNIRLGRDVAQR